MKRQIGLTYKVTGTFVCFAALLLAIVGFLAYNSGRDAMQNATIAELLSVAMAKEASLEKWLETPHAAIVSLATMPGIADDLARLVTAKAESAAAQAVRDHLVSEFRPFTKKDILSLFVMAPETGRIIVSTNPDEEGRFKEDRPFFTNGKNGPYVHGPYNSIDLGVPTITIAAPIKSSAGRLLGVLAGRLKLDDMSTVINENSGQYKTEDSYLVNSSSLFVTQPRFIFDRAALRLGIHTEAVQRGLRGENGHIFTKDYRGVPTITVYRWLPKYKLCLVVERAQKEAFAPSRAFGNIMLVISFLALLFASLIAVLLARTITRPILALQVGVDRFGRGETDIRLTEASGDELGDLAHEFNLMANAISEREMSLRHSEEWHRTILQTAMDGIWLVDLQGHLLEANGAYCRMSGYCAQELLAMRIPDLEAVEKDDNTAAHIQKVVAQGEDRFETQHRRKDGSIFDVEVSVQYQPKDGGQLVVFLRDITDRKRAEGQLREMTARLRLATDSAKAGVWDWNLQTNEMIWDNRMHELYGLTHENFPGGIKAWEQGLHPDDSVRAIEECQAALRGEKEFDTEFRVKHPDGNIVHIKASGLVLRDNDGKPLRMIGLNSDISDQRKAQEERKVFQERLLRAEKMESLGTLAGGVAHDLNNVLGIIVGYAEMVLEGTDKSSPNRKSLENIMNGGLKAAAIVEDLLTLARRGVQGRAILNINTFVADCQKSPEFANLLSHHPSVNIITNLEPDLLNISGSAVHLGKSLYNLISNASEAMPKGGTVTIRTTHQYLDKPIQGYDQIHSGDYVVLSVSDTGEGISEHDMKRIFEPFYTKKIMGRSGTGLGLAVVWGTIKDHNGYINVQSEEGKGSTFTLYFPVTREEVTTETASIPAEEYMGKGESILVVDDVKEQRDLAASLLKSLKYNVKSISSGEEAVAYLKTNKVDLMVLDMIMDPGMDGLDTYKQVIAISPKQKAIIVSGYSESDRVKEARRLGVGVYLRKPYIKEKLGVAVRKELDRK